MKWRNDKMNTFFVDLMFCASMRGRIYYVLLLCWLGTAGVAQAALTDALVLHWSFDDCTAKDNTGNGHDGAINAVQCVNGNKGKALQFDSMQSAVSTALVNVKKTYSVAMFVRFYSNDKVENQLFYLSRKDCKHRFGYLSTFPIGSKTWHWGSANFCNDEDVAAYEKDWASPRFGTETDPLGLATFRWYQVVFVLDDNRIKLYTDGILFSVVEAPYGSSIENYTNFVFTLGNSPEGNKHMDGEIDDVRLYNRALSDAEVKALYSDKSDVINFNATLSDKLDINVPDMTIEDKQQTIGQLNAQLSYAGNAADGSLLWKLKTYKFLNNTLPVANNKDAAKLLSNYDISFPFVEGVSLGKKIVYWGELKYTGDYKDNHTWKLGSYGVINQFP
jgi:hypothetical protein